MTSSLFTNKETYLEQRHTYLQQIQTLRKENKYQLKIYTDETWVNAHHNDEYIWVDKDGKGGWKVLSGKGQRLIVLHAGGVNGWVEGAYLVFTSKTNSTHYHDKAPTSNNTKATIQIWLDAHNILYNTTVTVFP